MEGHHTDLPNPVKFGLSMRNAVLVEEAVQSSRRLVEGALEEGLMVTVAVVVADRRAVGASSLSHVREAALHEREHVFGGRRIEDVVMLAA